MNQQTTHGIRVLAEGFGRLDDEVAGAVAGLSSEQLTERAGPTANSIAWLIWHLAREQDAQIAQLAGTEQVWTSGGWAERFGLPLPVSDNGYGQTPQQAASVRAPADLLVGYARAATAASLAYLDTLTDDDLDDVVDEAWDPPVTRGVRLVSVLDDAVQHVGQAAFWHGVLLAR